MVGHLLKFGAEQRNNVLLKVSLAEPLVTEGKDRQSDDNVGMSKLTRATRHVFAHEWDCKLIARAWHVRLRAQQTCVLPKERDSYTRGCCCCWFIWHTAMLGPGSKCHGRHLFD